MNAVRWYFVIRSAGFYVPFWKVFRIVINSGSLAIIPGRVGDFARSYPLRDKIPIHHTIGTIVLEKVIDVCVLLLYATIGLYVLGYYFGAIITFGATILAIPTMFAVEKLFKTATARSDSIIGKIHDAFINLRRITDNPSLFSLAVISSITDWVLTMMQFYWLMLAVNAPTPMIAVFAFLPLSIFAGLIPLTLAGTGTRDAALIFFFGAFATPSQALSAGILYGLQCYWIESLVLLPFLYLFFKKSAD